MNKTANKNSAVRAALFSLLCNVSLAAAKLTAGVIGGSAALISDAAHSLADVFCTLIALIGIKMSAKPPDREHPYGHGRLESLFALALSALLMATGAAIGFNGIKSLITGEYASEPPGIFPLAAAALCAIIKEAAYRYTRRAAVQTASDALMAEAWHHRADALASCGSFLGVLGAHMGFAALDCVACLVICALVLRAAAVIFKDCVKKLADTACGEALHRQIIACAVSQEGVQSVDKLHTRLVGGGVHIDIEISVGGDMTVRDGHDTAHLVRDAITRRFPCVLYCTVHVNPCAVS